MSTWQKLTRHKIAVSTRKSLGLYTWWCRYTWKPLEHPRRLRTVQFVHINLADVKLKLRMYFWTEYVFKLSKKTKKKQWRASENYCSCLRLEANSSLKWSKTCSVSQQMRVFGTLLWLLDDTKSTFLTVKGITWKVFTYIVLITSLIGTQHMQVPHGISLSLHNQFNALNWAPVCTKPKRNTEFSGCRLSIHNIYIMARITQQVTTALRAWKLPQADPTPV